MVYCINDQLIKYEGKGKNLLLKVNIDEVEFDNSPIFQSQSHEIILIEIAQVITI